MIISIDHGNYNIKTPNHIFPAGVIASGHLPNMGGDILEYNGKEYTLDERRMPYKPKKYEDQSYWLLTLFAIGKEFSSLKIHPPNEVELVVGLPPLDCKAQKEEFTNYFLKDVVKFKLNGVPYSVKINAVTLYPQAFAAALTMKDEIQKNTIVNVVDIGGITVDYLQMTRFKVDFALSGTINKGTRYLYDSINIQARARGEKNIQSTMIQGALLDDPKVIAGLSQTRLDSIYSTAAGFSADLLHEISQVGLDLNENLTVFVGGGSILLREYLEVPKALFVDNIKANVEGYSMLYRKSNQ